MFKDILIPSKVGHYYLFSKRVLSFEISSFAIHAMVTFFQGSSVRIIYNSTVVLQDDSKEEVVEAIKKLAKEAGKFDEVTTALSSSKIIYKELTLPFLGREKIEMVLRYEVESLFPFALEQAELDFMMTSENNKEKSSTILVAATLQDNVVEQMALFEKAGLSLQTLSVDMFALYNVYRYGMKSAQEVTPVLKSFLRKKDFVEEGSQSDQLKQTELLVDFSFDVTRILYINSGILKGVRIIPYGVADIIQNISTTLEISRDEVVKKLLLEGDGSLYAQEIKDRIIKLLQEVTKTVASFEKQVSPDYIKPSKILFFGLGCHLYECLSVAQSFFDVPVIEIVPTKILKSLTVTDDKKISFDVENITLLAVALSSKYDDHSNFLKRMETSDLTKKLYIQLVSIVVMTFICLGGIFSLSNSEIQRWNRAYNVSKKDLTATILKSVGLDLKSEKNIQNIVKKVENRVEKEHKLWFSFSKKTEQSYLEYLQDLSVKIDQKAVSLEVKKLVLNSEKITLAGSVPSFEKLELLNEELSELDLLSLVQKPRELSFNLEFKVKDKEDKHD